MADVPFLLFDPTGPNLLTGQSSEGDTAYSVRKADFRRGLTYEREEIGTPGPFTSILAGVYNNRTFVVSGLNDYQQVRDISIDFDLDVVDDGGVLSTAQFSKTNARIRVADPQYVDMFGASNRLIRDFKDGTDIGNANVFMTATYSAVQQDAENGSRTDEMIAYTGFTKLENGSAGYVCTFNAQGQNGNASGRSINADKVVQTVGSNSYVIGRAGQTTTIGEFVQLDLPEPDFQGTVNITDHFGIKQMDPNGRNVFKGPVSLENIELFLDNLPTSQPAGQNQVWRDGEFLKITPA